MDALTKLSELFTEKDKVRDMLFELHHDCLIAGGAAVYALNPSQLAEHVGDIDLFVRHFDDHRPIIDTLIAIVRAYFPDAKHHFHVHDWTGKDFTLLNMELPDERVELQFITSRFDGEDPEAFLRTFDIDYVMCGIFRGQTYITPECAESWENNYIAQVAINTNGRRLVKTCAKGFAVPYFGNRQNIDPITQEEIQTNVWIYYKLVNRNTFTRVVMRDPAIVSVERGQQVIKSRITPLDGFEFKIRMNSRNEASTFWTSCVSIELCFVQGGPRHEKDLRLYLDPMHKNTAVIHNTFEKVLRSRNLPYDDIPKSRPVSVIVWAYGWSNKSSIRLKVLRIWHPNPAPQHSLALDIKNDVSSEDFCPINTPLIER